MFSLQSLYRRFVYTEDEKKYSSEVLGCPWCRRPVTVETCDVFEDVAESFDEQQLQQNQLHASKTNNPKFAYTSVFYGTKPQYFLGALVLGYSIKDSPYDKVLLITKDVPKFYREKLETLWRLVEVPYLSVSNDQVSSTLYINSKRSRFGDVFTKLQVLTLVEYKKVVFLDLDMICREGQLVELDGLFQAGHKNFIETPGAMKRANPVLPHGSVIGYEQFWQGYDRKVWQNTDGSDWKEHLPSHKQASGINAGMMVLEPNLAVMKFIEDEIKDWYHPEHYGTFMPEQEYIGRLFSVLDTKHITEVYNGEAKVNALEGKPNQEQMEIDGNQMQLDWNQVKEDEAQSEECSKGFAQSKRTTGWKHVSACFNFEIDKVKRVPFDWSDDHKQLTLKIWETRSDDNVGSSATSSEDPCTACNDSHITSNCNEGDGRRTNISDSVVIYHYSGSQCKPWDRLELRTDPDWAKENCVDAEDDETVEFQGNITGGVCEGKVMNWRAIDPSEKERLTQLRTLPQNMVVPRLDFYFKDRVSSCLKNSYQSKSERIECYVIEKAVLEWLEMFFKTCVFVGLPCYVGNANILHSKDEEALA